MNHMDCERFHDEAIAERYVLRQLTDRDRDAFESHIFQCDACFSEVRALQTVATELQRTEASGPRYSRRVPALVWAAAAAGLIIAASAALWIGTRQSSVAAPATVAEPRPSSPATPRDTTAIDDTLARLARVDPPQYVTLAMRSAGEDRFEAAMEPYARGDHAHAADRLRAIGDADPSPPRVPFYLGASELMNGRPDAAIESLERVTTAGQAGYEEHARLLLAKAWLAKRRVPEARRELTACIALRGAHAGEARTLLQRLDAAATP